MSRLGQTFLTTNSVYSAYFLSPRDMLYSRYTSGYYFTFMGQIDLLRYMNTFTIP